MSNDFPRMLYKHGGPEEIHGGRFATLIVNDAVEQDAALADGWHPTTPEAKDADEAAKKAASEPAKIAPPTRAELEQKATELGITFNDKTSNKKLADLIAATIEE